MLSLIIAKTAFFYWLNDWYKIAIAYGASIAAKPFHPIKDAENVNYLLRLFFLE